jgi:hypothetical protein
METWKATCKADYWLGAFGLTGQGGDDISHIIFGYRSPPMVDSIHVSSQLLLFIKITLPLHSHTVVSVLYNQIEEHLTLKSEEMTCEYKHCVRSKQCFIAFRTFPLVCTWQGPARSHWTSAWSFLSSSQRPIVYLANLP